MDRKNETRRIERDNWREDKAKSSYGCDNYREDKAKIDIR
jgi:hypothetical protein